MTPDTSILKKGAFYVVINCFMRISMDAAVYFLLQKKPPNVVCFTTANTNHQNSTYRDTKVQWSTATTEMPKFLFWFIILYLVTFGAVLPYFSISHVYSVYFLEKNFNAEEILRETNAQRVYVAEQHLKSLIHPETHLRSHKDKLKTPLDILAVVKTVDRSVLNDNPYTGYLTQTVTTLDRHIAELSDSDFRVGLLICNTDTFPKRYSEAQRLALYYPTVERWSDPSSAFVTTPPPTFHRRDIEKGDFVYCMRAALNVSRPRYVLMVEDDAEPYEGFFSNLRYVLENRVESKVLAGDPSPNRDRWAYLRLYYPERWSGYGLEVRYISELVAVGCLTGTLAAICVKNVRFSSFVWFNFTMGAAYGILILLAVGRQHLMELRRLSSSLFIVDDAYRCCTPTVLYPSTVIEPISLYLSNITCTSRYGVDLALDQFTVDYAYERYLVQPNLVHHRGAYSSLTKPKLLKEFLFDST